MNDIEQMKDLLMSYCHMRAFNITRLGIFLYTRPEKQEAFKKFLLAILSDNIVNRNEYEHPTEWEFDTDKKYHQHILNMYDGIFPEI